MYHEPVMLNEVLEFIKNCRHKKILDGTLGLGGYSEAMLKNFPECFVLGLDRDQQAINFSRERLKNFELEKRFSACQKNFGSLSEIPDADSFDVYVFDLGVSNMQITTPERGFSFQSDGPLDMRMNPDGNSLTAREVLEQSDEKTLAEIFWKYGEERFSRQIASAVKKNKKPLETTGDLVNLIRSSLPQPVQRKMGTHPARRIFQALRIYVNDEMQELENLLKFMENFNRESLIIFVAYHSLEDRIIKKTFREWQSIGTGKVLTRHPMTPSELEIEKNYKARSAKLRAFFTNRD
ncbi:MAG: 16S rRNA (cytosine(1402)-N(4))-methyltransferase RsmH [Synergistales bacterium]|nr:16S rRNA (cytosine(1402)-N(4))-methyltransferase RsmH [Synergistales bacterium]MDY6401876.1 16S rRNA (cytosine(1402)-N(4))-methyltransferase RsmH [Synergistales bacterium]MDY6403890.1 16S rRNA (cytosine(1402)-N(4))-methyltransferase RsmH [Synergistales bacterium]MDY6409888.1 16S rRNA (cytosine(1402)-N(4))-methyltransferase RsmH [Synergistales bacterium]MDY6414798.1 16S rRNA (cytosine(1402)-N(4))-methyltransferase RsmH [Synergistales bacterium]